MKPRIDGTEAAVEAPSRRRVRPITEEVRAKPGEDGGDHPEQRPELHHPVVSDAVRQQPERRRQDELRRVEDAVMTASVVSSTRGPP